MSGADPGRATRRTASATPFDRRPVSQSVHVLVDDWPDDALETEDYSAIFLLTTLAGGEPPGPAARADLPAFMQRRIRMRVSSLVRPDEA